MISICVRSSCALLVAFIVLSSHQVFADDSIIPPIAGEFEVGQSLGAPRSGGRLHQGIDLFAEEGTPIVAIADAVVTGAGRGKRAGYWVRLQHESGVTTFYAHLVTYPEVSEGDIVAQGEVIGYVGETGNASTPHLHFELRKNSKILDPRDYYDEM